MRALANDTDVISFEPLENLPVARLYMYYSGGKYWGGDVVELLIYFSDCTRHEILLRKFPATSTQPSEEDLMRLRDQAVMIPDCDIPANDPQRTREQLELCASALTDLLRSLSSTEAHKRKTKQTLAHAIDLAQLVDDQDDETLVEVISLLDSKRLNKRPREHSEVAGDMERPKRVLQASKPECVIMRSALASMCNELEAVVAAHSSPSPSPQSSSQTF
jgi:hypothetical protein